ncbi:tripartite tricarboxylate transporter TctB family protein [Halomonas ramblicola]|uniref:tripartite tricarboxylate transporter TctB family protein n=1 Tax=Halomonas ramblicola TaxID=747349 RepID=UPI0025B5FF92|nr:tripartite tricarboxylate transporter TctB family protein [Halomonas ramblicola]MDN3523117.1 tripartite tricarboxylate transporter TctB family protein [Halomonas ramblicola]
MSDPLQDDAGRVPGVIGDRIAGALLLVLAVGAWWLSHDLESGFMQPIGPGEYPRLISLPLAALSLLLILKPGLNQRWPGRAALVRQALTLLVLASYAGLVKPLGFLPASLVAVVLLIRLFGAAWKPALVSGGVLTLGLYALFEFALGMPLPNIPGLDW